MIARIAARAQLSTNLRIAEARKRGAISAFQFSAFQLLPLHGPLCPLCHRPMHIPVPFFEKARGDYRPMRAPFELGAVALLGVFGK